jgi:uncharacterized protein (TIGR02145 family)
MRNLFIISILSSSLLFAVSCVGTKTNNGIAKGLNSNVFAFVDKRNGKQYTCAKIGNQVWMTQDFAYKTDSGCFAYRNRWKRASKNGYLYSWKTANSIAPEGWHLPSKAEYIVLLEYITRDKYDPRITWEKLQVNDFGINFKWNGLYNIDDDIYLKGIYPFRGTSLWTSDYGLNFKQTETYYTYFSIRHYERRIGFGVYSRNTALCVRYIKD